MMIKTVRDQKRWKEECDCQYCAIEMGEEGDVRGAVELIIKATDEPTEGIGKEWMEELEMRGVGKEYVRGAMDGVVQVIRALGSHPMNDALGLDSAGLYPLVALARVWWKLDGGKEIKEFDKVELP